MKRIQILFVTNNFVYNLVPIRRKFNLINDTITILVIKIQEHIWTGSNWGGGRQDPPFLIEMMKCSWALQCYNKLFRSSWRHQQHLIKTVKLLRASWMEPLMTGCWLLWCYKVGCFLKSLPDERPFKRTLSVPNRFYSLECDVWCGIYSKFLQSFGVLWLDLFNRLRYRFKSRTYFV